VVLTGQVAMRSFGRGALQESSTEGVNIVDVFKPMSRYSTLVFSGERLPDLWHKALRMALGGRPGPVHLSIPTDLQERPIPTRPSTRPAQTRANTHDRDAIKQAALHLLRARRPALLAGHGAVLSGAWTEIRQIAELLGIPVATTPKGKGVFPEDHRLALGPFGYSGSPLSQWYLLESGVDVLLTVGTSLSEWGTLGWDPRLQPSEALLQVDIDPYEIGKNYRATVPLMGDAKSVLSELWYELRRLQDTHRSSPARRMTIDAPPDRTRFLNAEAMASDAIPIKPQRLMRDLQEALPRDALVFVDGGANRSWAIHYWQSVYPRTFFCATGMASMGFGVAAAVGGKFAAPDRVVVSITGDGGFLMNGVEVSTAVHYQKQVIWIVLNDGGYGMIAHGLRRLKRPEVGVRFPRVDCAQWAESMGAQGLRVREPGEITPGLIARIVASGRPTVVDVEIDQSEAAPFGNRLATLTNFYEAN
jgi:acetolactate synthase-1/2/3 large subunit